MIMKRHNLILAGILVVQIILGVVVFWPNSATTAEREPLFPDLEGDDIVALTVTDAEGNDLALRKVSGEWVLPEADDYPAQADKVATLLDKIAGLTTGRLVARTDTSHRRLQVASDDFVRRVEVETEDGTGQTLYLGSSPGYGALHFRVEGQSETYLTNELSLQETQATAASWVDTAYLSVAQADLTRVRLENANGTFTFVRDDEGNWTMVGLGADETLAETKVTATIRQAASVRLSHPLGKEELPAYGMDEPNAVVTLETEDETITLRVGAQDPDDNSYVVKSSESPYYVRVSQMSADNLVNNTREDFLELPATPTPETAP
ncbi:MAG: DUF4340 domain-containing protein [Anaerolineae bacterium]|jgi:hypothetical protein